MVEHQADDFRERLEMLADPAGVLAAFFDHSPTPLAIYGRDSRLIRVNPEYQNFFGTTPAAGCELTDDEILGSSGVSFWLRRAFSGETITTPTFWYGQPASRTGDGRRRVALSARAFPLRDSSENIEFVVISFRDETDSLMLEERRRLSVEEPQRLLDEIHRADLERRTTEEQFRAVFEQCADGVMLTDDAGRVLDINPSGCRIFGRRIQDIVGSPFWEHTGQSADSRHLAERLVAEGEVTAEVEMRRADGKLRDLEMRAVANFLPGRHLTTFLDVTERNDALRSLQRNSAHLLASQRIANVGSWEYETLPPKKGWGTKPLVCSQECFRIFGLEPGDIEVTPELFFSFVHPDDRVGLTHALRSAIDSGSVYAYEFRITRTDGEERVIFVRGEILTGVDSAKPRLSGTTQDITERVLGRREIQRLNEELEERVAIRTAELEAANRDLEAFSYSVSHDLRAPLRAINGYAKILLEEETGGLDQDGQLALRRIAASARRMDGLIDGLLTLSRLGRRPTRVQTVATRPILREALDEVGLELGRQGVEVVVGDLPDCRADPALLRQIFVNLIGNAAKFSRDRSPARIEVGCRSIDGEQVWYVRDNGIGFDMNHAPKIFEVFRRLRGAEEYEGTGVGLAIVDRIVRLHGGRVWTEAVPEAGATFYFTL